MSKSSCIIIAVIAFIVGGLIGSAITYDRAKCKVKSTTLQFQVPGSNQKSQFKIIEKDKGNNQ